VEERLWAGVRCWKYMIRSVWRFNYQHSSVRRVAKAKLGKIGQTGVGKLASSFLFARMEEQRAQNPTTSTAYILSGINAEEASSDIRQLGRTH